MKRFAVIINLKAKNASSSKDYTDVFSKHDLPYQLYKIEPQDLDKTLKHCKEHHDLVLVGGGDGTIRSAAQHYFNSPTLIGIVPLGTMNHFATELDLPADAEELSQAIIKRQIKRIDLASVNQLVFVNNSSIGFYPAFAKKRGHYNKFYNKWISYVPGFIEALKKHKRYNLFIKYDHVQIKLKTSFLMISNNLYTWQFPASAKRVSFNQGKLGIYFLKKGKFQIRKVIRHLFKLTKEFDVKASTAAVEVELPAYKKIVVSLDGETLLVTTPLLYQSHPESLNILAKA